MDFQLDPGTNLVRSFFVRVYEDQPFVRFSANVTNNGGRYKDIYCRVYLSPRPYSLLLTSFYIIFQVFFFFVCVLDEFIFFIIFSDSGVLVNYASLLQMDIPAGSQAQTNVPKKNKKNKKKFFDLFSVQNNRFFMFNNDER